MLSKEVCIYEYQQILLGKQKKFVMCFQNFAEERTNSYDENKTSKSRKKNTEANAVELGYIWNYAVTKLLGLNKNNCVDFLTPSVVKALKLDKTFCAFNEEDKVTNYTDYTYFLQYAFPESISFDVKEQALEEYKKMMKIEKYANSEEKPRYPKGFFTDSYGFNRALCCLEYAISLYLGDMTLYEQYEFFKSDKAYKWLEKKKLDTPVRKGMFKTPFEYFYNSLPEPERFEQSNPKVI